MAANGTIGNDNNPVLVTLGLLQDNEDDDGVGGPEIIQGGNINSSGSGLCEAAPIGSIATKMPPTDEHL